MRSNETYEQYQDRMLRSQPASRTTSQKTTKVTPAKPGTKVVRGTVTRVKRGW
jgi:hypothetical protein